MSRSLSHAATVVLPRSCLLRQPSVPVPRRSIHSARGRSSRPQECTSRPAKQVASVSTHELTAPSSTSRISFRKTVDQVTASTDTSTHQAQDNSEMTTKEPEFLKNRGGAEEESRQAVQGEEKKLSIYGRENERLLKGTHPASERGFPQHSVKANCLNSCLICEEEICWESNATLKWAEDTQEYVIANTEYCLRCDPQQASAAALLLSLGNQEEEAESDEPLDFSKRDEDLHGKHGMTDEEFVALVEWLEIPGNFDKVEDISQQSKPGTWRAMSDYIANKGGRQFISLRMYSLYAKYMERYRNAYNALKRGTTYEEQLEGLCPNFRRLHKLYRGDRSIVLRKYSVPNNRRQRVQPDPDANELPEVRVRIREMKHMQWMAAAKYKHELMLSLVKSERPVQELVVLYNLLNDQINAGTAVDKPH